MATSSKTIKIDKHSLFIIIGLIAIVIILILFIALSKAGAIKGETFIDKLKDTFSFDFGGNGSGDSGNGDEVPKECEQYNIPKEFRNHFGDTPIDIVRIFCESYYAGGWTETYNEMSCYVDGATAINCSNPNYTVLKKFCEDDLEAKWVCRPDFAGCLCKESPPNPYDYECGFLYEAGLGECGGKCDSGEKCILEEFIWGFKCHCVAYTSEAEEDCEDHWYWESEDYNRDPYEWCKKFSCPIDQTCYAKDIWVTLGEYKWQCYCKEEQEEEPTYTCGWVGQTCLGTCPPTHPTCEEIDWVSGDTACACLDLSEHVHPDWKPDGPYYDPQEEPEEPVGTIFQSSGKWNGNMGGLAGADSKCASAASSASLSGTWRALLSTTSVDARDRIPDTEYRRIDGVLIANSKADLFDGTIANAIKINEFGNVEEWSHVATGSETDGTMHLPPEWSPDVTCYDWTSNAGDGERGINTYTTGTWISAGNSNSCGSDAHSLYCVKIS